jgi:hypothetical protein
VSEGIGRGDRYARQLFVRIGHCISTGSVIMSQQCRVADGKKEGSATVGKEGAERQSVSEGTRPGTCHYLAALAAVPTSR